MLRGSCLCGAVAFEMDRTEGPFELCHCRRCRKISGSGYLGTFRVPADAYRGVRGDDVVLHFALPVRDTPPAYAYDFCGRCGCVLPGLDAHAGVVEVPVGLIDDELGLRPDRHIFVEHRPGWDRDLDALPHLTGDELRTLRARG
jgi:hypothetical protein